MECALFLKDKRWMEFVTEEDGVEYGIKVTYIEDKNVVFPESLLQKNTQVIPW